MQLVVFQLVSLFALLGVSVVGVAIPFCFGAGKRGEHLLALGNSFAGACGGGGRRHAWINRMVWRPPAVPAPRPRHDLCRNLPPAMPRSSGRHGPCTGLWVAPTVDGGDAYTHTAWQPPQL